VAEAKGVGRFLTERVLSAAGALLLALVGYVLPIVLPPDSFRSKGALVYDSFVTSAPSALLVKEFQDHQNLYALRKYVGIVSIDNSSLQDVDGKIQVKTNIESDSHAFVSFSKNYFWEDQSVISSPKAGIWNVQLRSFSPKARMVLTVVADEDFEIQDVSVSDRGISLIEGGRPLVDRARSSGGRDLILGSLWSIIGILFLILMMRFFKIGLAFRRVASEKSGKEVLNNG
jgi:hypothetical protein